MDTDTVNWKSKDGEALLSEVLTIAQRRAFFSGHRAASEERTCAEMDVEEEEGEGQKAKRLERAFRRLKNSALETEEYGEEPAEMPDLGPDPRPTPRNRRPRTRHEI